MHGRFDAFFCQKWVQLVGSMISIKLLTRCLECSLTTLIVLDSGTLKTLNFTLSIFKLELFY